jgi:hypothetical protein
MEIIFGGQLENAMIYHLDKAGPSGLEWGEKDEQPFYEYSTQARDLLRELGLFLTLATRVFVPNHYWMPPANIGKMPSPFPVQKRSGIKTDEDTWSLACRIVHQKALSAETVRHIELHGEDLARFQRRRVGDPSPAVVQADVIRHSLDRLFAQIKQAGETGETIAVTLDDAALLKEVSSYIASSNVPLAFPFPDLSGSAVATAASFGGGVLEFNPIDGEALAAVCADRSVKRYAAEVRRHLGVGDPEGVETGLLDAMRKALKWRDRISTAEWVFEVANWVAKPLPFFVGLPIDGAKIALARKKKKVEWFRFAAVTSQVAVEDYLRRKGNIHSPK